MKLQYDKEVDAAYIYLEYPIKDKAVEKTIQLNDNIILDFNTNGKLMGVEIIDASKLLDKKVILEAEVA